MGEGQREREKKGRKCHVTTPSTTHAHYHDDTTEEDEAEGGGQRGKAREGSE